MNYKKIECDNYDILLVDNKKFHDFEISVNFTENINKRKVTFRNVLIELLNYSCHKYNTTAKLLRKCQDIYSSYPRCSAKRYGNLLRTKFSISTVDSIYISQDNIIKNIELLSEVILHPWIENKSLKSIYYSLIKKTLTSEVLSLKENTGLYANFKAIEGLKEDENYSLTGLCDLDILDKIDEKMMYEAYQEFLRDSYIDIIIAGNISNEQKIVDAVKKFFVIPNSKPSKLNTSCFIHQKSKQKLEVVKETTVASQSKLSLVCKICDVKEKKEQIILSVYNLLLGGMSNCLLMKNVREKNNLCYHIGSYYYRLDGTLIINSGITIGSFDKALEIIKKTLDDISFGKFTLKELENAKMEYLADLARIDESNGNISEYVYGREVFNSLSVEEKINLIKKITKEDIIRVAKKVLIVTGYLLEGVDNGI